MPDTFTRFRAGHEEIEYAVRGEGEPLLLLHAGVFADWFTSIAALPTLDGFQLIRVRRAGYVEGARPTRHLTIADHARHAALLLDALRICTAHVCGHSSSALIALQLTLDRPDLVHDLLLLEPAPGGDLLGPRNAPVIPAVIGPAMAAYAAGNVALGFDRFMTAVCGAHHPEVLTRALGGDGYARAIRESAFFPDEAIAVQEWAFNAADAARIRVPTLIVQGARTATAAAVSPEAVAILASMLDDASVVLLEDTTHLMPLEAPLGVADVLADFAFRNPITGPAPRLTP